MYQKKDQEYHNYYTFALLAPEKLQGHKIHSFDPSSFTSSAVGRLIANKLHLEDHTAPRIFFKIVGLL